MNSRGCILIVDDEDDLRNLMAKVLQLEDFTVYTASTPQQAFHILDNKEIEVVISDVRLEVANGLDLIPEYNRKDLLLRLSCSPHTVIFLME